MCVLQASLSLPGSPFDKRRTSQYSVSWARNNDRRSGDRMPLVLQNLEDQENLPFADESAADSPLSEESGTVLEAHPSNNASLLQSRHSSYTSHTSRLSYTSHGMEPPVCVPSWTRNKYRTAQFFHEVRSFFFLRKS